MVRIGGLVEVGLVTIDTVGWSPCVSAIGMTQATVGRLMLAIQRPNQIVVECGSQPGVGRCPMTGLTVYGESRLLMVGIGGLVVVGLVAIDTVSGRPCVPSVWMTQAAVCDLMLPV